jgi:hypothetical protein
MTAVLIEEARQIHENAHLSDDDLARATGAGPSTLRAWLAGSRSPTGERAERLNELSALVERLMPVIDPAYIPVWLRKPIPALGDEKPINLIAAGRYREVARVIASLESPGAS